MKKQSGFSLIGILLTIIIIAVAYYFITRSNLSTATFLDKKTKKTLKEQGINTDNYKEMIDGTKNKIEEVGRKIKDQEKYTRDLIDNN